MEEFIPYLVIAVVVIIFFLICYWLFKSPQSKDAGLHQTNGKRVGEKRYKAQSNRQERANSMPYRRDDTRTSMNTYSETTTDDEHTSLSNRKHAIEEADRMVGNRLTGSHTTVVPKQLVEEMPATDGAEDDVERDFYSPIDEPYDDMDIDSNDTQTSATLVMPAVDTQHRNVPMDETRVISTSAMWDTHSMGKTCGVADASKMGIAHNKDATESMVPKSHVDIAMAPFLHYFGGVSEATRKAVTEITTDALYHLDVTHPEEAQALLESIVVQEAMLCMQKAYAATPTFWMKSAALEAFLDVVQEPKSSTPYLVAFDALRILPHLTLGHFQIMAIILLLQYSRNSNNYTLDYFQHYVEKYIEPFISDIPRDNSVFRQLEYLRCSMPEREQITFAHLMSNSYPFVFNFRGFTIEELERAMGGESLPTSFVVKSMNSSLYKLAIVDESMAQALFRQAHINDIDIQQRLIGLMKSKPTSFSGAEARNILEKISPVLLDLADIFDSGELSNMSLTLLGLYLGRAHVKATIGEEFDISRWF